MGFTSADILIVVVYMAASVGFGAWIGRKQSNTTDYFLGGRDIPWIAVTLSIVATETSVLTFISIPAVAYLGNLTFIQIVFGYMLGFVGGAHSLHFINSRYSVRGFNLVHYFAIIIIAGLRII